MWQQLKVISILWAKVKIKWVYFGSSVVQQMCCLSVSFSDCGTCYQLNMGVVIGIITCDIILTLLITISVYCFVSREKRKNSLHACKNSSETGMCVFVCLREKDLDVNINELVTSSCLKTKENFASPQADQRRWKLQSHLIR